LQTLVVLALPLLYYGSCSATEGNPAISGAVELDLVSKYVWRGIPLSKNEAYQPSLTLSGYGFTGNIWLNYSLDKPTKGKISETDYALSYEQKVPGATATPGFVLYTFPEAATYGEAYVKLSCPVYSLKIITDHYLSMISGDIAGGYYGDAGLGYEKELGKGSLWASSALLGWGNAESNAFNYAAAGLPAQLNVLVLDTAVTIKLSENGSIRPHLTFHTSLPGGLRSTIRSAGNDPDSLVAGLAATYGF